MLAIIEANLFISCTIETLVFKPIDGIFDLAAKEGQKL